MLGMVASGKDGDDTTQPTFLRLDRAELSDNHFVIRAIAPQVRDARRMAQTSPLGYLYERSTGDEPETDLTLAAGQYDQANLVWSFSGDVTGIVGLTEPTLGPSQPSRRSDDNHACAASAQDVPVHDGGPRERGIAGRG